MYGFFVGSGVGMSLAASGEKTANQRLYVRALCGGHDPVR